MILVTVGTIPFPMNRMSRFVELLAGKTGDHIVYQYGHSRIPEEKIGSLELYREMPYLRFRQVMKKADTVICHGGPATIFQALEAGKKPFVLPREQKYGEHVNDHQVCYTEYLYYKHMISLLTFSGKESVDIKKILRPGGDVPGSKYRHLELLEYFMKIHPRV